MNARVRDSMASITPRFDADGRGMLRHVIVNKIEHVMFLVCPGNYLHAFYSGHFVGLHLRVAACDGHYSIRIYFSCVPYELPRFAVGHISHRAGVYYVYVSEIIFAYYLVSATGKLLFHGFCLILIDFAA